jgi:hypothetical protein
VGQARQELRAEWSSPTSVPYDSAPRPVESTLVDLWLAAPTGDSTRYDPTGTPGQFSVSVIVRSGETYRLSGTVAGRAVAAQARIPGVLVVNQPADDTLRQGINGPVLVDVPFVWRADSAAAYQAFLVHADSVRRAVFIRRPTDSTGRIYPITIDTSGHLLLPTPFDGMADTARLIIFGYDAATTAFLSSTNRGNVRGAFGLFGAATSSEKAVVWE